MKRIDGIRILRFFIYALPVCLIFSYYPIISLGSSSSMNFELSLPLILLTLFDIVAIIMMIVKKKIGVVLRGWMWLLLPIFATLSLIWSYDKVRGLLTVGILWLIYIAGFTIFAFRKELFNKDVWRKFFKIFLVAMAGASVWCFIQCILDLTGVPRDCSLLCPGCVYGIFGFPHPNGFAAEPQFMGNLLLAPIIVSLYFLMRGEVFNRKMMAGLFFLYTMALFLTMSRGAIYAFIISLVVFTVFWIVKTKKYKVLLTWLMVIVSFFVTLNIQGLMAEVSRTDDTYTSGMSKVISQLTLGVIDLKADSKEEERVNEEIVEEEDEKEEAIFNGYVEVSTSSRLDSWKGALEIWSGDVKTALFGVGLGGAPVARYENGKYHTAKEIINNEYINMLLELGLIGIGLIIFTVVMVIRITFKLKNVEMIFALLAAYGVSMCFFSGLPNVLHIYLLMPIFMIYGLKKLESLV